MKETSQEREPILEGRPLLSSVILGVRVDHWSWIFRILKEKTEVQTYVKLTDLQILPIKTFLKTLNTKQTLSVGVVQPAALQLEACSKP